MKEKEYPFGRITIEQENDFAGSTFRIPAKFATGGKQLTREIPEAIVTSLANEGNLVYFLIPGEEGIHRCYAEDIQVIKIIQKDVGIEVNAKDDVTNITDIPYIHVSDLAVQYKKAGLDRQQAWKQYILDSRLQRKVRTEDVDAKTFFDKYFDVA